MILETLEVGPLAVNCYVLGSRDGGEGVIIDPGDEPDEIMRVVKAHRLSGKIRYILATHGHFDHVGAAKRLKELTSAPFLIHKNDLELLDILEEQAGYFGCPEVEKPHVDRFVVDGDVISFDNIELRVAHTPGHSKGGVCYLTEDRVFVGDTLFAGSVGRTDFPGCSSEELANSIRSKLLSLGDGVKVYPGHGPTTTIGRERRSNPFLVGLRF
ncbi:MAG: MBL fold metallo-hydrolase [Planctomycetes bacterium RIFCSPHIGHO2_02_FULL_50_42]|uniref:MBL fold metallo-hydrolase n=1 Tax=Candidatus Avalokitesvara rifleensis TaxID=3367620 RepID=UPI0008C431EF|nr:MBL fold metallo-hydrolase [Candidatus Brocadiales bacterium]OHB38691.1 MAG: MBL fold metallo-hydrolase [Planctomycetes bacterium GWA2_50_13]OHB87699.1 MAG: MBL fold metallo-hydrolase [Planctomycetes bacterium RIFCSPHIGHO2_02_FULL_50_42]OHB92696.1 MAG: MBL fold metallo-hydrolase [Planctomycetes bacterium RIFCSPHIGHO2_12_FULL_51_37]OHB94946.1 MAG: MBL fold metallo-hydrolase [Planctomycetes bacterium RIFCSPLOWO2_02_FULL_50_16]OHC03002.1 MAG: MBL fold metallo-hydrolase [Planctomycetes bacteriu